MNGLVGNQVDLVLIGLDIIHNAMDNGVNAEYGKERNPYTEMIGSGNGQQNHETPRDTVNGQGGKVVVSIQGIRSVLLPPLFLFAIEMFIMIPPVCCLEVLICPGVWSASRLDCRVSDCLLTPLHCAFPYTHGAVFSEH